MVRPRSAALLLFALLAPLQAGEIAPVFFPAADAATRKRMAQLAKELGDSTLEKREAARRELAAIGVWAQPVLADHLAGGAVRQKVNAALTLPRIEDPDSVALLRLHADTVDDEVRRAVCLALGVFGDPADLGVLADLCANPRNRLGELPEAALALARAPGSAPALAGATAKLPENERLAAAFILAAALADPTSRPEAHLGHRKEVVLRAAAAALVLRPPEDPAPILDALRKGRGDRNTRMLLYVALGALPPSGQVREVLLDCATKDREKTGARAAACIALGREWGVTANAPALERALKGAKDDLVAPLMFALVRTGTDGAIDFLLRQAGSTDKKRHEPAGALLLHMLASVRDGERHPRHDEILRALADERHDAVRQPAQAARAKTEWPAFREHALKVVATIPAPFDLWTLTWEERRWALVNDILPEILGLDDIPDWGNPANTQLKDRQGKTYEDGRGNRASATPWEQDLISFLRERPYFVPGDLR